MITIERIKELLAQVALFARTLSAIASELEAQDARLKALEENRKLKDKAISSLTQDVATLKLLARRKVNENA